MDTIATPAQLASHPAVEWLRNEYLPTIGNNMTRAADELGISDKVLRGLLSGNYAGNRAAQLAKLEEQRQRLTAQVRSLQGQDLAHVQTELMARCWSAFEAAKRAHLANYVCGKSQIGKTTAAEAYKQAYPETTVFFRMPTRPTIASLTAELLKAARLPKGRTVAEGMAKLCDTLSPRHVIIADEAHLALTRRQGIDALDVLRELYDRTGCGLVLIVTDIGGREVVKGPWAEQLLQIERRGEWEILPAAPSSKDVLAIAAAYGLERPEAETWRIVEAMARATCFGQFVHRLKMAAVIAQGEGRPVTWQDFININARMGRRPE